MTASEFEERWKAEKITKTVDFIHMIQVGLDHLKFIIIFCTAVLYFLATGGNKSN